MINDTEEFEYVMAKLEEKELCEQNIEDKCKALMRFWNRLSDEDRPFIYFQEIPLGRIPDMRMRGRFSVDHRGIPEWNETAEKIASGRNTNWNPDGSRKQ